MKMKSIRTDSSLQVQMLKNNSDGKPGKGKKNPGLQMLSLLIWYPARTESICIRQFL